MAFPATLDIGIGDRQWQASMVLAALLSTAGIRLFTAIGSGGEARPRVLHVFLALAVNAIIRVTRCRWAGPTDRTDRRRCRVVAQLDQLTACIAQPMLGTARSLPRGGSECRRCP